MAGKTLTINSVLTCPHGATIIAVPSQTKVLVDGVPALTQNDTFTIAGCPFQIPAAPSPIPNPCTQVIWQVTDSKVKVSGALTLSEGSVGLCLGLNGLPQGTVVINPIQFKVDSM